MVYNNSGSHWVIGHVICSQQLWLSVGYLSCYMVQNNSGSQWVIGHVIWFRITLALSGLLVMLYGSQ